MPDFSLITGSFQPVGIGIESWSDPETPPGTLAPFARPTRINPSQGIQHLRYSARVDAVLTFEFITDAGSTTFAVLGWLAEAPGPFPWPIVTESASPTSVTFQPQRIGHHTLVVRHELGGELVIHIDVEG
jgi:hypothetical protein